MRVPNNCNDDEDDIGLRDIFFSAADEDDEDDDSDEEMETVQVSEPPAKKSKTVKK